MRLAHSCVCQSRDFLLGLAEYPQLVLFLPELKVRRNADKPAVEVGQVCNSIARNTSGWINDRNAPPHEPVEDARLADVRPTDNYYLRYGHNNMGGPSGLIMPHPTHPINTTCLGYARRPLDTHIKYIPS